MGDDSLESVLLGLAEQDPQRFLALFNSSRDASPIQVARACLRQLARDHGGPLTDLMLPWLLAHVAYLDLLADPVLLPAADSQRLAELFRAKDSRFFVLFTASLPSGEEPESEAILARRLSLLEGLSDYGTLYYWLQKLSEHPSRNIRSKAVKLIRRIRPSTAAVMRHLSSDDARIRANAVEALWGLNNSDAVAVFQHATGDPDHRVVVNALVGLQACPAQAENAFQALSSLKEHPSEKFRAAVIWALGRLPGHQSIPVLEFLLNDPSEAIRNNARRSLDKAEADSRPPQPDLIGNQ